MSDKRTEELTDELIKEATFVATRTMGLCLTKEFGDAISKSATEKERARIMAIIEKRREIVNSTINSSSGIARKIYDLGWDECMSWLLKEIESKE